mmetsp:Transcript_603/g.1021  ORF Transcript_603/g.1021 Transcript_603/m.1021 type:complete len:162 (-) Transcript_603:4005-4490(-)
MGTRMQKYMDDTQLANETVAKRDKQVRVLLQKVKSQENDLLKFTDEVRRNERSLLELKHRQPSKETPDISMTQLKKELAQATQKLMAKENEMELLREMMASWQSKYRAQEMERIRKGFRESPGTNKLRPINHSARVSQGFDDEADKTWLKKSRDNLEIDPA